MWQEESGRGPHTAGASQPGPPPASPRGSSLNWWDTLGDRLSLTLAPQADLRDHPRALTSLRLAKWWPLGLGMAFTHLRNCGEWAWIKGWLPQGEWAKGLSLNVVSTSPSLTLGGEGKGNGDRKGWGDGWYAFLSRAGNQGFGGAFPQGPSASVPEGSGWRAIAPP